MTADPKQQGSHQKAWAVWATALVLVAAFLLVVLLMVGIPYLNANLVRGTGLTSGDLASWQLTALLSMVGMLITGVFVITAFRVDATAKHIAFEEVRKRVVDIDQAVKNAKTRVKALKKEGRRNIGTALVQSRQTFSESIEQIRADGQAVREFLDERAPGLVRESLTDDQLGAIRQLVADRLTDEFLAERFDQALTDALEREPQRFVDPVVDRVIDLGRWRWLFRRERRPSR